MKFGQSSLIGNHIREMTSTHQQGQNGRTLRSFRSLQASP